MKILFLCKDLTYNGGGERMAINLANELSVTNNVSVISLDYSNGKCLYQIDEKIRVIYTNIKRRKINFLTKFDYCNWLKDNKKFVDSFDIVIGVGIICNLILAIVANSFSSTMLAWEHNSYNNVPSYQKFLRKLLFKKLDGVIVLTYQDFPKYKKVNKNSYVIYNFTQMPIQQHLNNTKKRFIWIGRLSHQKGIEYLEQIIKKFCERNSEWDFKIIGKGENQRQFIDFVKKEKLDSRIEYQEASNNVQEELDNSGCMLMTSLAEGLPMVLIEAQTRGVPAISFNTETGPAEIISNEETGFLVDCYDTKYFVEKMLYFAQNKKLQIEMSNKCIEKSKKFKKSEKVKEWLVTLEKLKNED